MKILNLKFPDRLRHRLVFLGLALMYCLSLAGAGFVVVSYEKYLGNSSPIQSWLNNEYSTSYSTDIYDALFAMQEVSIAYRALMQNESSQEARQYLKDRVDMYTDALMIFSPDTEIGQHIDMYVAATETIQTAKVFLNTISQKIREPQSISTSSIFSAEEAALISMRRLVTEAELKELQARDDMVIALNSSRILADRALLIGIVLFIFGLLALISVYWASRAWMAAERERFERLEYLLSTVGHDLRSPLQAILSCSQLLRKAITSSANQTYADIIKDSSEQLARLVDDLIGLARNEELKSNPQPLDLSQWINKLVARFMVDTERKGLELIVSANEPILPTILFDETRLTQCVGNLLSNAIRYTDTGSIKLTLTHTKTNNEVGEILIEVEDTGVGIADKDQTRIFMPFERASTKDHGKGLGLAIASSIVRAAHGQISLDTAVGVGSTFSILMPVTYSTMHTTAESPTSDIPPKSHNTNNAKVLIVDDDPALRTTFAGLIADMGYTSDQASDGEQAFNLARDRDTPYHAIITDIQMPGWDGFKLAQACRDHLRPCPILIAITAYTTTLDGDPRAAIFDHVFYKPIEDEQLLAALET